MCRKKWEELKELFEDLESAPPTSRASQRLRQRLQHLLNRLQNIEVQPGTSEAKTAVESLKNLVSAALHAPPVVPLRTPEKNPLSPVVEPEVRQERADPLPGFSRMAAACYHKLPNPLTDIIQQLPVIDGLDEDKLLHSFGTLFQLSDFPGMSDKTLLELIYPYWRSPMAERVTHTMRCGGSLEFFHGEVLDSFIPGRLRGQLRQKHNFIACSPMAKA